MTVPEQSPAVDAGEEANAFDTADPAAGKNPALDEAKSSVQLGDVSFALDQKLTDDDESAGLIVSPPTRASTMIEDLSGFFNEEEDDAAKKESLTEDTQPPRDEEETQPDSVRLLIASTRSMILAEFEKHEANNSKFKLHQDTYSLFLTCEFFSPMVLIATVVAALQIALYGLALASATDFSSGGSNPLNIPANVEASVSAAQFLSLAIAILVQDSLRESIFLVENFEVLMDSIEGVTKLKMFTCFFMKISESLLSLLLMLVLICQKEDVVELLMDFAALLFVSSLDNIVFGVGKEGYLGRNFKREAAVVERVRFFTSGRKRRKVILRASTMSIIYVSLLIGWIIICPIRQKNGYYLSDEGVAQFPGGSSDSSLPFFTGIYKLDKDREHDRRLMYVEASAASKYNQAVPGGRRAQQVQVRYPAYFAYCKTLKAWVFVAGGSEENNSPCSNFKAFSDTYLGYDLMATASLTWFLNDGTKEPIKNFYLQKLNGQRKADPASFGIRNEFDVPCADLHLDELKGLLVASRQFASSYSILQTADGAIAEVYTRPVYVNPATLDIIVYTGSSWVLTGAPFLRDYTPGTNLAAYLTNEFHSYWSDYDAFLTTETVVFSSEKDSPTPVGLNWFIYNEQEREADGNSPVDALLLCSVCHNEKNPCFYRGQCQENGECRCTTGSSGKLCQVPPTGNGHCDAFFNTLAFSWDGGDCCKATCKSVRDQYCGWENSGRFPVDFALCRDPDVYRCEASDSSNNCWTTSGIPIYGEGNNAEAGYSIANTESVLVVGEPGTGTVRVFDRFGPDFVFRDSLPSSGLDRFGAAVAVSARENIYPSNARFTKPTVAAAGSSIFHVYEWSYENGSWDDISPAESSPEDFRDLSTIGLYDEGRTFAVFELNETAGRTSVWKRNFGDNDWLELPAVSGDFRDFSMTDDGELLLASHANEPNASIYVYNDNHGAYEPHGFLALNGLATAIKVSGLGQVVATLGLTNGDTYRKELCLHDLSDSENGYVLRRPCIRGIELSSLSKDSIELNDDGSLVTLITKDKKLVQTFHLNDNGYWDQFENDIQGFSALLVGDDELLVGEPKDDTAGSNRGVVSVYGRKRPLCEEGDMFLDFSINFDNFPEQTWWQLFDQKSGTVFAQDGPFESIDANLVTRRTYCVRQDRCLSLFVYDTRGNGLASPGGFAVHLDGVLVATRDFEAGLVNFVNIGPGQNCPSSIYPDLVQNPLFDTCGNSTCDWYLDGPEIVGFVDGGEFGTVTRLSSDGKFLVASARDSPGTSQDFSDERPIGEVRAFTVMDGSSDWVQVGNTLYGSNQWEYFGEAMALARDAKLFVVGAPGFADWGSNHTHGAVRVYEFQDLEWELKGSGIFEVPPELELQYDYYQLGRSVAISDDGNVFAAVGTQFGFIDFILVFEWNDEDEDWIQHAEALTFNQTYYCGDVGGLALGDNGRILAVACPNEAEYAGRVRVYEYEDGVYIPMGQTVGGDDPWDKLGAAGDWLSYVYGDAVSLSSDGLTLAAGSEGIYSEYVKVWRFINGSWRQLGQKIPSGFIVSLSGDGDMIAIGNPVGDWDYANYGAAGLVSVLYYAEDIDAWLQLGSQMKGAPISFFGNSVSLTPDGSRLAASAFNFNPASGGSDVGRARVFVLQPAASQESDAQNSKNLICDENNDILVVEILMDKFPQDVGVEVWSSDAESIAFLTFEDTVSGETVIQRFCLADTKARFDITDKFHDGICCASGDGHYRLTLNNKVVHEGGAFGNRDTVCLSHNGVPVKVVLSCPRSKASLVRDERLEHLRADHSVVEVWRKSGEVNSIGGASRISSSSTGCAPNGCLVYTVDELTDSVTYMVDYTGNEIRSENFQEGPFVNNFESYWFGNCQEQLCDNEDIIFQVSLKEKGHWALGTIDYANRWKLLDFSGDVLWSAGPSSTLRSSSNFWTCAPKEECLTFTLSWDVVNELSYLTSGPFFATLIWTKAESTKNVTVGDGGSSLSIWNSHDGVQPNPYLKDWDGAFSLYYNESKLIDLREHIRFPKVYQVGNCDKPCKEGLSKLYLQASVGAFPNAVWSIFGPDNVAIITQGYSESDASKNPTYTFCFQSTESFVFSAAFGSGVGIQASWANNPLEFKFGSAHFGRAAGGCEHGMVPLSKHLWFPRSSLFDGCEITCDSGYSVFQLKAITGSDPTSSYWSIFRKDAGATAILEHRFSEVDANQEIAYTYCISNQASHYFFYTGLDVRYELYWDGVPFDLEKGFTHFGSNTECQQSFVPFNFFIRMDEESGVGYGGTPGSLRAWDVGPSWSVSDENNDAIIIGQRNPSKEKARMYRFGMCLPGPNNCYLFHWLSWYASGFSIWDEGIPGGILLVALGEEVYNMAEPDRLLRFVLPLGENCPEISGNYTYPFDNYMF